MIVLGVESSCDECSFALVEDGRRVIAEATYSQIEEHKRFDGVVPELAGRLHVQRVSQVYHECLKLAGLRPQEIDGVAVTNRPGLLGSLLVGLGFAKSLAWAWGKPLVGVDHILAHLWAPQLEAPLDYPFLGLLVSGGHSLILQADSFEQVTVLGTTIDDAVGEAFDKVAKALGLGYPGGKVIDTLAAEGDSRAFVFPKPRLLKRDNPYDVSYSGLKTAVLHQRDRFLRPGAEPSLPNLCASFQKTAVDTLLLKLKQAVQATGLKRVVAAGGVAANSYLRRSLGAWTQVQARYPALRYCTDNASMVAGLGYNLLARGEHHGWALGAESRVRRFKNGLR